MKSKEVEVEVEVEVEEEAPKVARKPSSISFPDNPPIISPPQPFPQRFQKKKMDNLSPKFLEIFK